MKLNLFFVLLSFQISAQITILSENFTNYLGTSASVPSGWFFSTNANYTTAVNAGTSGPNSYKFQVTNAKIISPPFTQADSLQFWIRGNGTDSASLLTIEESADSLNWSAISVLNNLPGSGSKFGFSLLSTTTHLRFTYTKSVGNLAFDDLIITKKNIISSPGSFKIYFNHPANTNIAANEQAIFLNQSLDDTLIQYINRAKYTLDIAVYNYSQTSLISPIYTAINNAYLRGVKIRWVYDGLSANTSLSLLNTAIPKLASPTTSSYGIMHNKFMIADANSVNSADAIVWTGSCNWTDQQFNSDFNNVLIIQNQNLAQTYRLEFEEMWGDTGMVFNTTNSKFGPYKSDNTFHYFNVGGVSFECYFSPSDGTNTHILNEIRKANSQLFFGMYTFTLQNDADTIKDKILNSGIYCRGITDPVSTSFAAYASLNPVMGSGLQLFNTTTTLYHNKFMLVDPCDLNSDPTVETGSQNWTAAADTKNDENILIIHNANIANIYFQSFWQNFIDVGGSISNCFVGIDNLNVLDDGLTIFPNPANEFISIEEKGVKINSINIYDLTSRKIISLNNFQNEEINIDVRLLNEGLYILEINFGGKKINKRISVTH